MTKNKRFKVKGFDEYDQMVWDTEFEQSCSVEQVVNMLNNKDWVIDTLEEENEMLKEILKHTYEVHECETCKHIQYFNWLDPATMKREYDSECSKGLHYGEEVHDCEEYELDLEMFKKRVKG